MLELFLAIEGKSTSNCRENLQTSHTIDISIYLMGKNTLGCKASPPQSKDYKMGICFLLSKHTALILIF
jgi:hypothetical protein